MRVLIIDDDENCLDLDRHIVESVLGAGVEVLTVMSAREAEPEIDRNHWDAIIFDYRLPGGTSGLDLARRAIAVGTHAILIIATGMPLAVEAVLTPSESRRIEVVNKDLRIRRLIGTALSPLAACA